MFADCSSLTKLNINNFNISNSTEVYFMFSKCPYKIKNQIKSQFNNIGCEAFLDWN